MPTNITLDISIMYGTMRLRHGKEKPFNTEFLAAVSKKHTSGDAVTHPKNKGRYSQEAATFYVLNTKCIQQHMFAF